MIRIAIADDNISNRKIIKEKLSKNSKFVLVIEAVNGEDFLEKMYRMEMGEHPKIVLMDLEMPVLDGITTIATASSLYPHIKFVVLTVFDDDDKIFKAIKAGACGYLLKEESSENISELLIALAANGAGPISASIAYKILQMLKESENSSENNIEKNNVNIFKLSEREIEILQFLSKGLEYKEIAVQLFISANTVKKHCINIYQKLHVNSKTQALRIAYSKGLIKL